MKIWRIDLQTHNHFWTMHPALLASLLAAVGASSYLFWDAPWPMLWICASAFYLYILQRPFWVIFLLLFWGYAYLLFHDIHHFVLPTEKRGLFSPSALHLRANAFGEGWLYEGHFQVDGRSFPTTFYWSSQHPNRPPGHRSFWIQGRLESDHSPYRLFLTPSLPRTWESHGSGYSFAEMRCQLKEHVSMLLSTHLRHTENVLFLTALFTGEVEEPWLRATCGKIGIQHVLAVSGFHFALLAAVGLTLLRRCVSETSALMTLLIALSSYAFFVGSAPSVLRAWLTFSLWIVGQLLHRTPRALNLLGVALFIEILLDPLSLSNLGLQFSFCSVGAILLLQPPIRACCMRFFPERTRREYAHLSVLSCVGALSVRTLLRALSLTCAIHLAMVPLLLYHFHSFPWLSLFYNLFIPAGAAISLLGCTLALPMTYLFPPIAMWLWTVLDTWTYELLQYALHAPITCDFVLLTPTFPAWIIPPYLFCLLCGSLAYSSTREPFSM